MSSWRSGTIISASVFLLSLTSISFFPTATAYYLLNYSEFYCNTTTSPTPNTTTLTHLFKSLSSKTSTTLFYNSTFSPSPNTTIYALYLCRGDVNSTTCSTCISAATSQIQSYCKNTHSAIVWKEQCMLRYSSNRDIFSSLDVSPIKLEVNENIITKEVKTWKNLLNITIGNVTALAAAAAGVKKFATFAYGNWDMKTMYSLAECTPDLSSDECEECFKVAIKQIRVDHKGGIVMLPSCNLRFEVYPFYQQFQVATPSSVPPVSSTGSDGVVGVGGESSNKRKKKHKVVRVVLSVALSVVILVGLCIVLGCWRFRKRYYNTFNHNKNHEDEVDDLTTPESLQFDFGLLQSATGSFSLNHKIGHGGFGSVYRGTLPSQREVAIKRLSRKSEQGIEEFKNEVVVVAKLQHKNLVRLLGFCLKGDEKLLVYEYVQNQSLDYFIFDSRKERKLNWATRFGIICGIARGMVYLHEDSRPRIIHRDLKASNILLDENMEPKIADFGMARIFGENQTHDLTKRVAGTHGYMAPEYVVQGRYSDKSDVYSFGVLVLEIISGMKNSSFYQTGLADDLLTYVWKLWVEGTPLDFMEMTIRKDPQFSKSEVKRSIQIGLLCVQKDPEKRPTMVAVVQMLNTSSFTNLPSPQRPGFVAATSGSNSSQQQQLASGSDHSGGKSVNSSSTANNLSITELDPR